MGKVIVLNDSGRYTVPFVREGYEVERFSTTHKSARQIVSALSQPEVTHLVFTGGEDVTPSFYGMDAHPMTNFNFVRDAEEAIAFRVGIARQLNMTGICRGSQFLNVMVGGKMHQHIQGHGIAGTHAICDLGLGIEVQVTSTHHQVSYLPKGSILIAHGMQNCELPELDQTEAWVNYAFNEGSVISGVQFHPEYMHPNSEGYKYYQGFINHYFFKEQGE